MNQNIIRLLEYVPSDVFQAILMDFIRHYSHLISSPLADVLLFIFEDAIGLSRPLIDMIFDSYGMPTIILTFALSRIAADMITTIFCPLFTDYVVYILNNTSQWKDFAGVIRKLFGIANDQSLFVEFILDESGNINENILVEKYGNNSEFARSYILSIIELSQQLKTLDKNETSRVIDEIDRQLAVLRELYFRETPVYGNFNIISSKKFSKFTNFFDKLNNYIPQKFNYVFVQSGVQDLLNRSADYLLSMTKSMIPTPNYDGPIPFMPEDFLGVIFPQEMITYFGISLFSIYLVNSIAVPAISLFITRLIIKSNASQEVLSSVMDFMKIMSDFNILVLETLDYQVNDEAVFSNMRINEAKLTDVYKDLSEEARPIIEEIIGLYYRIQVEENDIAKKDLQIIKLSNKLNAKMRKYKQKV